MRWRILLALGLLALAAVVFGLWRAGWFSFAAVKEHHAVLLGWTLGCPLAARAAFFLFFVTATALSMPVTTLLSLLAGSLFGFWEGLLLVSVASSAGATLAMLLSRYALRGVVERRWPQWIAAINTGLARDGTFYLLALRLAPAPPFFVVNLLMGLTRVPAWRFFVISQIGMLPLDIVFVNAGRTLATLRLPEDILDAGTLTAFALASLLPLLLRALMRSRIPVPS